ncbi:MAG: leucine--tRNA ligase [Chloroflexi bacterium]|nr:leucine--tRNA ligase [Chloroflexota bacterium]
MAERYEPRQVERRWQEEWERSGIYRVDERSDAPKYYALNMFPYTSGDLHIGHWYHFGPADSHARYKRMRGYNVLEPIGFDAFGLPAEEAAINHGVHPYVWTMNNIRRMEEQLRTIGAMYDWSREIATCAPEYYRWNQWLFLKFFERGLAYRAKAPANWCPHCQTVLANEQVIGGRCERCDTLVTRRDLEQWFFRITAFAEQLLDDLDEIDWPERVKTMQRNWIGKSHGAEFRLKVAGRDDLEIPVFTTRLDTVFGMTYVVLAPEHPLVDELLAADRVSDVREYQEQARRATEIERLSTEREKTGVFLGAEAVNPAGGERVPIWIADYVLASYGTGAIMAVPAHDQRDFEFAQQFGLPIRAVIRPPDRDAGTRAAGGERNGTTPAERGGASPSTEGTVGSEGVPIAAYVDSGVMVNSGQFDGLPSDVGMERVADWFEALGIGERTVNYRLRDWLISRQRYWGTPIPVVYCPTCGIVPVPEDQLPVLLPEDAEFRPTGLSPLTYYEAFVETTCPRCGGPGRRETDTMDTFVDSSWYMLRYCNPRVDDAPFDRRAVEHWMPVDQYLGGVEHAVMHLLYARFFIKALHDMGLVSFKEPFSRLFNQGIILGPDGHRMSKSRGNVVNPDDYVQRMGADTVRCYLMFIAPWDSGGPWSPQGISGVEAFLHRVWGLVLDGVAGNAPNDHGSADERIVRLMHKMSKGVTEDIERFRFNTMLAKLMEATNSLVRLRGQASKRIWREASERLVLLLAPSAPHLTEELWHRLGHQQSVHLQSWPGYDEALIAEPMITLVIQVNSRVRDKLEVPADISEEGARRLAQESPRVQAHLDGATVRQVVYVPGRLVNIVASRA